MVLGIGIAAIVGAILISRGEKNQDEAPSMPQGAAGGAAANDDRDSASTGYPAPGQDGQLPPLNQLPPPKTVYPAQGKDGQPLPPKTAYPVQGKDGSAAPIKRRPALSVRL